MSKHLFISIGMCPHGWMYCEQGPNGTKIMHGLSRDDLLRNIEQSISDVEVSYVVDDARTCNDHTPPS
jgi:hypothetical protein